ncbi:4Fe-4S dicluster domain-containing protein [Geomesophilobacter sediminis]|uniref:4Fe-4S dicluster domain-containing protein n=1 Tax=Geomesophilobacter sediminis TaxID=2798584 RepID=A0A8J7J5D9_9BACT|nr:4Fe-4S dicluster domain-containing protein [Geomesophilobacter sediminis]MBJ6723626.1 4Fe-4S dicluster domain-containing protein [Geomesophilobacter sediminis]
MRMSWLPQGHLEAFLNLLEPYGTVHGPTVLENGVTALAPITSPDDLELKYRHTLIPPKKYLLPFRDPILTLNDGCYRPAPPVAPNLVLFGLHRCDLQAISYLDRVFLGDDPDPNYAGRRERLTLVGLSCEPDDFCYCDPAQPAAVDLFLDQAENGFLVTPHSPRGEKIMSEGTGLFLSSDHLPSLLVPLAPPPTPQDPELRFSDNPLWEEYARICLSCGACSACCPTCYCFDVREYPSLDHGGNRLREWDNCLFKKHGEVAGGDFRRSRLDRLRYRFLHKYCGFSPLQGVTSCVGCGRCAKACPVGIDLRNVLEVTYRGAEPATTRDQATGTGEVS